MGDATRELSHGFHLLRVRQTAFALPQRLLNVPAITNVMDHSRKVAPAIRLELADRKVHRKDAPVLATTADLTADADDFFDAGGDVAGNVAVVLAAIGLRHEHFDVLPEGLGGA